MRKTFLAAAVVMIAFPILAASSVSASAPKIDVSHAQAVCDASGTISFSPPSTVTLSKGSLKASFDAAGLRARNSSTSRRCSTAR